MADQVVPHLYVPAYPWRLQPVATVVILTGFVVYSVWVALQGHGYAAPYLSPFSSPPVRVGGIPISLAWWVLWVLAGVRATCHVLREHGGTDRYYGPRFMVRIAGLEMHPKDTLS